MDFLLTLSQQRGYFLRREALEVGVDDRALARGLRGGVLVRIRQGAYCHVATWGQLSETEQHLARAHATQDLSVHECVLSHISALLHYGCPIWGADLERVHVTRTQDRASRVSARSSHHRGVLLASDVVRHQGRLVTSATRSTLDSLALLSVESGMVAGNWMLHQGLTSPEDLWEGKQRLNHWPGTLRHEVTLRLLDGRIASVGESRCLHLFYRMGLPRPVPQYPIVGQDGHPVAFADFGWPGANVYGEFDGREKYGRLLKPGQDPGDAVFAEKRREDQIRALTGGTMVRFTWSDLHPQSTPARRLDALLRSAA